MIRETSGDILTADVEALVNPVNTVGVMGAGLALQFKRKYPDMFNGYVAACRRGDVRVGEVMFHYNGNNPRYIFNFPTKQRWQKPSRLEWIDSGLADMSKTMLYLKIESIAIPPLGCGLGGLNWGDVRQLINGHLGGFDVDVVLYAPQQS